MTTPPPAPGPGPAGTGNSAVRACTWHSDRRTALTCSRCGRPACPECLAPAAVGFHCRGCVAEARSAQRAAAPRTAVGARVSAVNPAHRQPRVTYALIGLNVLVFLVVAVQAGSASQGALARSTIYRQSLLVPYFTGHGDWWRIVSSGFLHLSVTHIAMNMLALYFIGVGLERVLGTWRYLAIYALSLLGGSACVMIFAAPLSGSAGASGAIFGLMGALLVTMRRLRLDMRQVGIIIALNLVITFAIPGISWQAHIGGLIVGAAVGAGIVYAPTVNRLHWQIGACVAVAVVVLGVIVVRDLALADYVCLQYPDGHTQCMPQSEVPSGVT